MSVTHSTGASRAKRGTSSSCVTQSGASRRCCCLGAYALVPRRRRAFVPTQSYEALRMAADFKWDEVHLSEELADSLLRLLGYEFVAADALDGERESLAEPVLVKRLEAALRRLN